MGPPFFSLFPLVPSTGGIRVCLGLPLGLEARVMMPAAVTFLFFSYHVWLLTVGHRVQAAALAFLGAMPAYQPVFPLMSVAISSRAHADDYLLRDSCQ